MVLGVPLRLPWLTGEGGRRCCPSPELVAIMAEEFPLVS